PGGSVTTFGLAHTVCWLTDTARSTPLTSKIAPRSAASLMVRIRWLAPSFSYWEAETAWTWVRRRITAESPRERTISSAMARRPVRRPLVAARPASALARRAAMRRLGLGGPPPRVVVLTRGWRGAGRRSSGRLSSGLGAPGVRGVPGDRRARRSPLRSSGLGAPGVRGVPGDRRARRSPLWSSGLGAKVRLHLFPSADQARGGGIVVSGAGRLGAGGGIGRGGHHQIGDLGRHDHAEALLG